MRAYALQCGRWGIVRGIRRRLALDCSGSRRAVLTLLVPQGPLVRSHGAERSV